MSNLKIRNSSNTGWIDAASASGFRIRNQSNTGWINKTGNPSGFKVRNTANTGWIEFTPYSISPSTTTANEGDTVVFTVTTSGIANGTVLYWTNTGTTTGADFTGSQNNGTVTINSNSGTISRSLVADFTTEGSETIILQLRTGSVAGPIVATSTTVTVTDSSITPAFPTSMTMTRNDLEFVYSGVKTSTVNTAYMEIVMTIDASNFWSFLPNSNDHMVFALDPVGDSSVVAPNGTRDHCGQILRHGEPLFDQARGFILAKDGGLLAEHWYQGAGFGLYDMGFGFDPTNPINHIFTVRIRAGYRAGAYGERMEIDIFRGTSTAGTVLTGGGVSWGWDWSGNHRLVLGAICTNFVSPNTTGCIESTRLGNSYGATVGISNFNFTIVQ